MNEEKKKRRKKKTVEEAQNSYEVNIFRLPQNRSSWRGWQEINARIDFSADVRCLGAAGKGSRGGGSWRRGAALALGSKTWMIFFRFVPVTSRHSGSSLLHFSPSSPFLSVTPASAVPSPSPRSCISSLTFPFFFLAAPSSVASSFF